MLLVPANMLKSYRTKRRKNLNDLLLLNCSYESVVSLNNKYSNSYQPLEINHSKDPLSSSTNKIDKNVQSHASVINDILSIKFVM